MAAKTANFEKDLAGDTVLVIKSGTVTVQVDVARDVASPDWVDAQDATDLGVGVHVVRLGRCRARFVPTAAVYQVY